jgi:hypothetical protein
VVPGLRFEVILGRPYLDKLAPLDVFTVETIGPIQEGGKLRPLSLPEEKAQRDFLLEALANNWIQQTS